MRGLCLLLLFGCGLNDGADVTRNKPGGDPSHDPTLPDGGHADFGDLRGVDFAGGKDSGGGVSGILSGGPCASGASGATAIRARWVNAGGQADSQIEAFGMPDSSREKVGVFGFQIGFQSVFDDNFLGPGGLVLDGSDFIDIELSSVGVSSIRSATVAIFGRSFATGASGSLNWQTFDGTGGTPDDFVSNIVPYQWYQADLSGGISGGDNMVLVRVKAGPSSGSLIVNRIEICLDAS